MISQGPEDEEHLYDTFEAIADIGIVVGECLSKDQLHYPAIEGGIRGLTGWVIDKALLFTRDNMGREWDGEYPEEIANYTHDCLVADGMVEEKIYTKQEARDDLQARLFHDR